MAIQTRLTRTESGETPLDQDERPESAKSAVRPKTRAQPLPRLPSRPRVLVLGIVPSLTWSVTRCLLLARMRPVVLGWHRVSPMAWAPDCTYVPLQNVRWIDGELAPELIVQVEQACHDHRIDMLVPVDFPSVMLVSRQSDQVVSSRVAAVPDPDTMNALHNKWLFSRRLERLGLPQPRTEIASSDAELAQTKLRFPIITKPVDRWAGVGFQVHETSHVLHERIRQRGLAAEFPLLVQERIPGRDVGFAFLARHGELIAHTAFESPRLGVRRYFDAPELREHVATLLADTGYHGIGEVDTRYDPTPGEFRLLEVNPRFWASMLYAEHAGMNFPQLLVRLEELSEGPGFAGSPEPVNLTGYELMMSKSVQLAERTHQVLHRWIDS